MSVSSPPPTGGEEAEKKNWPASRPPRICPQWGREMSDDLVSSQGNEQTAATTSEVRAFKCPNCGYPSEGKGREITARVDEKIGVNDKRIGTAQAATK